MKTLSWSAAVALLALVVCVPNAGAEQLKCKKAIAKSSSQFVQAKVKALAKCNEGIVKTGSGTCPDAKASAAITKAETKMRSTIDKTCGGTDKLCGGVTTNEDTPTSVGWPATCPNFESGACNNAIADCGGIADCIACIGEAAVDQAITLYYDDLVPGTVGQKPLNGCQISIGKATSAFLNAKSKALQKCWDARLAGKHNDNCDGVLPGDGKYIASIQKADIKKISTICKACGGADKGCDQTVNGAAIITLGTGGTDDLTPGAIGFPANCAAVTIPGGASCAQPIVTLADLVECVDCVTEYKVDCIDRLQVPEFTPYPSECNNAAPGCMLPPPTGPCPGTIQFTANGGDADLDTGFTGLAHDAPIPTNGRVTLAVSNCAGGSQPTCGQCDVAGPLPNGGGPAFDTQRCADQPWTHCTSQTDCDNAGALGPCSFFFGPPLPLRAGGVSTCILNRVISAVAGTINFTDGSSTTHVPLVSTVATSSDEFNPCPKCTNQQCVAGANNGTACTAASECPGGTCTKVCLDGPNTGQACVINGTGIYGDVSLDCPPQPGNVVANLGIDLNIATGEQTRTVSALNPTCRATGYSALKCLCDTCNNLGQDACATNADCPVSGGQPGICGGRRCLGGPLAGQPCLQCAGGTNPGAPCTTDAACTGGGTCPNSCGTCSGGVIPGANCSANAGCNPKQCAGGANDGAVCTTASECPGGICPAKRCLGGANSTTPCTNTTECPGGTCSTPSGGTCGGQCNRPGQDTKPNECNTIDNPPAGCEATAGNQGVCTDGPVDQVCSIQTFRTCTGDPDCNPFPGTCPQCIPGQTCILKNRPCFPGNGVIGSEVKVSGQADPPCGGVSNPTVGTFFCVSPVGATAVNAASGLPALGRVLLPGVVVVDP